MNIYNFNLTSWNSMPSIKFLFLAELHITDDKYISSSD